MAQRSSSLGPLLDAWGVDFDPTQVLGDRELGLTVALRQGDTPSQHIAIIGFNRASMNAKDVVTSTLDSINVMTAGALKKKEGATITFEPLIQSSTNAALLPAARLAFLPDSERAARWLQGDGRALRCSGTHQRQAQVGVSERRPPAAKGAAPAGEHRAESAEDANLIIVADTDVLADPLWVRTQNVFGQRFAVAWANNGDFVANAVDNLSGSSDLISIRGRQSFFRPFTRVEELRRRGRRSAARQGEGTRSGTARYRAETVRAGGGPRRTDGSLSLSPEQEAELQRFQQERVRVRKELRDVRRSLDVEIERLGTTLKVLNIALVPALLAIGAILLAVARRRRLRAGRAAAQTG